LTPWLHDQEGKAFSTCARPWQRKQMRIVGTS
jgi:hypothetical protein